MTGTVNGLDARQVETAWDTLFKMADGSDDGGAGVGAPAVPGVPPVIKVDTSATEAKLDAVSQKLEGAVKKLDMLASVAGLAGIVQSLEDKFDIFDARFSGLDARFAGLETLIIRAASGEVLTHVGRP